MTTIQPDLITPTGLLTTALAIVTLSIVLTSCEGGGSGGGGGGVSSSTRKAIQREFRKNPAKASKKYGV